MKKPAVILLASGTVFASAASAAPVARSADLTLTVEFPSILTDDIFEPPYNPVPVTLEFTSTGATVSVDSAAGTLSIAAGAVAQTAPETRLVWGNTAAASVKAISIRNLSGVFSLDGGAVTSPTTELPCPSASPVVAGIACVTAGGANLGGQMGLSGTIFVVIVPGLVTMPLHLGSAKVGVGGTGATPTYGYFFYYDAAPWTQGKGKVAFTTTSIVFTSMGTVTNTWTTQTTTTGAGGNLNSPASGTFTLVSPTYWFALGNQLPVFTKLEIHFIPEPGTAILVAAGLAGLAAAGRRRSLD